MGKNLIGVDETTVVVEDQLVFRMAKIDARRRRWDFNWMEVIDLEKIKAGPDPLAELDRLLDQMRQAFRRRLRIEMDV